MQKIASSVRNALLGSLVVAASPGAMAGPVHQPPGVNLVFGDVTHGQRIQSASSNPASAAADIARGTEIRTRGTVLSVAAGIEYGNVQELFDFYDDLTNGYVPSPPPDFPDGPVHLPEDGGIDLGDIWDSLDPDVQETVEAVATEIAVQTALLALVSREGYARAWLAGDAPFVLGGEHLGGTWTYGINWSGTSKALGLTAEIDFDRDAARDALQDWLESLPGLPTGQPPPVELGDETVVTIDPETNAVHLFIDTDSSMLSKATQTTELNIGYSRPAWSNSKGTLYLGAEVRAYFMRLSRLSARFGDITDSEEVFDAIRDSNFRNDEAIGVDFGALWVGPNYQVGAQVTNVNQPTFVFPDIDLDPYRNESIIGQLQSDQRYKMDSQLKFEASIFSSNRRWSAHLGFDADPATDPMGDRYQWATVSAGFTNDGWWLPSVRLGYRENLAGTRMKYVGLGVTAFKILNIDISSAMDTVRIEGRTLPQGLMASIGFQLTW